MYQFENLTNLADYEISVILATENGSLSCSHIYRDGEVQKIKSNLGYGNTLTITPKKVLHFHDGKCRNEPYGVLLTKNFLKNIEQCPQPCMRHKFCQILDDTVTNLQVCNNEAQKVCFDDILDKTQKNITIQPCTKLYYK